MRSKKGFFFPKSKIVHMSYQLSLKYTIQKAQIVVDMNTKMNRPIIILFCMVRNVNDIFVHLIKIITN